MKAQSNIRDLSSGVIAGLLLSLMALLAGGAALRESVTIDEVPHIGAGVSYLQKLDLRMNGEHPPLIKVLAALPLVSRGVRADYSHPSWSFSGPGFPDKLTLLRQRNHAIAKHPETTFIALHVANWSENLDGVSEWLRTYPNMYVEFGARQAELGRRSAFNQRWQISRRGTGSPGFCGRFGFCGAGACSVGICLCGARDF